MNIKKLLLLAVLTTASCHIMAQSTDSVAAIIKADKWVKSRVWAKNLKLKLFPAVNSVVFEKQYQSNPGLWDKVFNYLDTAKLETMPAGKYPIAGTTLFASITNAPDKKFEDTKWESHRKVIDLQYIIKGKEKMGVSPLTAATVIVPYNEAKDVANYTAEGKFFTATPEEFFLFFPQDAHRPSIKVDDNPVKKLVIKITYTP